MTGVRILFAEDDETIAAHVVASLSASGFEVVRVADKAVAAYDLAAHVQGRDDEVAKNAVEALIGRLRRKIGPDRIVTRRGFGYIIAGDDE